MIIKIDFNSNEAIYMQLRNQIVLDIAREHIKDGESLPSVRKLANDLGVNMHTVNKAYTILKQEGYLQLDRRNGAVVSINYENKVIDYNSMNTNMELIVAEGICKGMSLDDMQNLLKTTYKNIKEIEKFLEN